MANEFEFSSMLSRISNFNFAVRRHFWLRIILATSFALSQIAIPSTSDAAISTGLVRKCERPPKILIKAPSISPKFVKIKPRGARLAIKTGWVLLGLTRFDRDLRTLIKWDLHDDGKNICLRAKTIEVNLGNEDVRVWLSPALNRNSCLKELVLAHELRHVMHHQEYLYRLEKIIRVELSPALVGRTFRIFKLGGNKRAIKNRIEIEVGAILSKLHRPIAKAAMRRDQAIDTQSAYAKELENCNF